MVALPIITNDRNVREAEALIARIDEALSSEQVLKAIVEGLPREVIEGVRRTLSVERHELSEAVHDYLEAKAGRPERLTSRVGADPGSSLIVSRIARGWSQKELARRVFLPEQQIQRYEAEHYRSISLAGLIRIGRALGVRITADLASAIDSVFIPAFETSSSDLQKVLKHARDAGWIERIGKSDDALITDIRRTIAEHVGEHGTPSLFRAGLKVREDSEDWFLLAWKAQVTRKALAQQNRIRFRPTDVSWLSALVKLSAQEDGPVAAQRMLAEHGIVLVIEPQIAGMGIDAAAFLVGDTPVIAMTLLRDAIDNFWYTLLHEIGHVILHYRTGLAAGFFDDVESASVDEMEAEADKFASNMLIPEQLWLRSPARISRSTAPMEKLAGQLGISPAIVFGRIRFERKDFALFSDKIGRGTIRRLFEQKSKELVHDMA
jgi:HTH-type transcriptional regulator/antitoxin HigA